MAQTRVVKSVYLAFFKNGLSYLSEIFSICSSQEFAKLTKKIWLLLTQPASYGPFRPKLWMPLATIFVEIFQKEKKWRGSGPIEVLQYFFNYLTSK